MPTYKQHEVKFGRQHRTLEKIYRQRKSADSQTSSNFLLVLGAPAVARSQEARVPAPGRPKSTPQWSHNWNGSGGQLFIGAVGVGVWGEQL